MAASAITGQGVSSRSSHSEAAGRTTPSAKPRTQSRTSRWSSDSSSEKAWVSVVAAKEGGLRGRARYTGPARGGAASPGGRTLVYGLRANSCPRAAPSGYFALWMFT